MYSQDGTPLWFRVKDVVQCNSVPLCNINFQSEFKLSTHPGTALAQLELNIDLTMECRRSRANVNVLCLRVHMPGDHEPHQKEALRSQRSKSLRLTRAAAAKSHTSPRHLELGFPFHYPLSRVAVYHPGPGPQSTQVDTAVTITPIRLSNREDSRIL